MHSRSRTFFGKAPKNSAFSLLNPPNMQFPRKRAFAEWMVRCLHWQRSVICSIQRTELHHEKQNQAFWGEENGDLPSGHPSGGHRLHSRSQRDLLPFDPGHSQRRRFALFLETVLLLAICSLLIRLSTGWLLSVLFAHVLTCIGIQQLLLDASPDSRKKLGYVILFSAVFVLAMLAIAFAGRNAQNKMQPVCQEAWRL